MIKKLHHAAYRCENSEETRKFYKDFLRLPLVHAFEINETKQGEKPLSFIRSIEWTIVLT